jgi:hypothetical protein
MPKKLQKKLQVPTLPKDKINSYNLIRENIDNEFKIKQQPVSNSKKKSSLILIRFIT